MKSKTMYLEGVSQNSDSFLVDHGGVFMSPVIGTTVGQCLKNSAFGCLAKRQVHRNGSCSRGAQTIIPLEVQTRDDRMRRTLSAACGTLTANADGLPRTSLFTLVHRWLFRTIYRPD